MIETAPPRYGLVGSFQAQPGQGGALAAILLQAARLMELAPGCRLYLVGRDARDADRIWVSEVWDSQAAHDASLGLAGVAPLIAAALPLLAAPPQGGITLDVLGGTGLAGA